MGLKVGECVAERLWWNACFLGHRNIE
jgi:hypothetical protein